MVLRITGRQAGGRSARWLVAGAAVLAPETSARAGFLQPEGETQVITSGAASRFSRQFDAKGRLRRAESFSKTSLETYVERGLDARVMGIVRAGTEQLTPQILDEAASVQQARFVEVGARLFAGEWNGVRLSAQALGGWRACICGGQGFTMDVRGLAAIPFQFAEFKGFAETQFGYRHGGPAERSEFRVDVSLGVRPRADVLLLAQLFGAASRREGQLPAASRLKAELGVVWDFSHNWSLQIGAFTNVTGRNAGHESGARVALWRRFTPPPATPGF